MHATSQHAGLVLNFFAGGAMSFYVEGMVTFNASHTVDVQGLSWTNYMSECHTFGDRRLSLRDLGMRGY